MDLQERDRLEKLRQELISGLDYSTIDAWLQSAERVAAVYRAGDIYPAVMALRILCQNQPPKDDDRWPWPGIGQFTPMLAIKRCAQKCNTNQFTEKFHDALCTIDSESLEGQELMLYQEFRGTKPA